MNTCINNMRVTVQSISHGGYLPLIVVDGGAEFHVAPNRQKAGDASRRYWKDMIEHNPEEFVCIVGANTLIKWAIGKPASPGSIKVTSLAEWLDVVANHPQEDWAGYDSEECLVSDSSDSLCKALGFVPGVAYRHN